MHNTQDVRKSMEFDKLEHDKPKKQRKTCPIKQDEGDKTYYCSREGCAWWSPQENQCVVVSIATHLRLATISRDGPEW